ncbi:MAG: YjbQ family protein [Chloroflexi bacterium]|nr:YjbQ family protein [Chloroflexota bacterium]
MGPGITVPLSDGELVLGTWQQIVVNDHGNRPFLNIQAINSPGKSNFSQSKKRIYNIQIYIRKLRT